MARIGLLAMVNGEFWSDVADEDRLPILQAMLDEDAHRSVELERIVSVDVLGEDVAVSLEARTDDVEAARDLDEDSVVFEFCETLSVTEPNPTWPANLGHGELSELHERN